MVVKEFSERPEGFNEYLNHEGKLVRIDPTRAHNLLCLLESAKNTMGDVVIVYDGEEGCQPAGSKVLLSNGSWKNIEDIKVGDKVLSPQPDGTSTFETVTDTVNWYSYKNYIVKNLYRKQTELYRCSANHLIPVYDRVIPRVNGTRPFSGNYWRQRNIEAREYALLSSHIKKNRTTPTMQVVERFEGAIDPQVDPYTLGAFLGDGHTSKDGTTYNITSNDPEIIERIKKAVPIMSVGTKQGTTAKTYRISKKTEFVQYIISSGLQGKYSGEKFIPKECLVASKEFRMQLLAGLLDTDGTLSKTCNYSITSKSKQLVNDIEFLVRSLGGRTYINKFTKSIKSRNFTGEYYNISFYLTIQVPSALLRKTKPNQRFYISSNRTCIDLEEDGEYRVYGFSITGQSKLYITDNYCVTHNSGKSTIARQDARLLDPEFTEDRIEFDPESAIKAHFKGLPENWDPKAYMRGEYPNKPWQCIILDESAKLDRKRTMSAGSVEFSGFMTQSRQLHKIFFIVLPNIHMLDSYVAQHRCLALIHNYKHEKQHMGFYKWFNRKQLKIMFTTEMHKRKLYPARDSFSGRFSGVDPFDLTKYERKKAAALNYYRKAELGQGENINAADLLFQYQNECIKRGVEAQYVDKHIYTILGLAYRTGQDRKKSLIKSGFLKAIPRFGAAKAAAELTKTIVKEQTNSSNEQKTPDVVDEFMKS